MTTDNQTLVISSPDGAALATEAKGHLVMAESFTIDCPEVYSLAADELKGIKGRKKELESQRKAITAPIDAAKAAVMDLFRKPIDLLDKAEGAYKRSMLAYDNEQRRIAAEQQAAINKVAAEERAKAEAAAKALAATGDEEAAESMHIAAATITAPTVMRATPKASGISTRSTWSANVTDKRALIEFVLQNYEEYSHLVAPVQKELDALARAMKANLKVGGVAPIESQSLSARAA
jgi:hypothetical protein